MEARACADEISDNRRVTNRCSAYIPARVISLDACGGEKACDIPPLTFAPRCAESINSECYPSVDTCRKVLLAVCKIFIHAGILDRKRMRFSFFLVAAPKRMFR